MKIRLFFVALTAIFICRGAEVCEIATATIQEARDWADVVFAGEVTGVRTLNAKEIVVTFKVSRIWKGELRNGTILQVDRARLSYNGHIAEVGDLLLVYAKRTKTKHSFDGACARIDPAIYDSEELKTLGRSRIPGL